MINDKHQLLLISTLFPGRSRSPQPAVMVVESRVGARAALSYATRLHMAPMWVSTSHWATRRPRVHVRQERRNCCTGRPVREYEPTTRSAPAMS